MSPVLWSQHVRKAAYGACAFSLLVFGLTVSSPRSALAGSVSSPTVVAKAIVDAFDRLFGGPHPSFRSVHAKGILLEGRFVPDPHAAQLSRAIHLQGASVPIVVRFSDFAGVPTIADNAPEANPKGMAVKFMLSDGGSTDIVAHSYNGFPAATPEEFLAFLTALGSGPEQFATHVASHPAARLFVDAPKPAPLSFASESYFGVNAFNFKNAEGVSHFGKYYFAPLAGEAHLTDAQAAAEKPDYLFSEVQARLRNGPIRFALRVQLAEAGDSLTDGSFPWPRSRRFVQLGILELTAVGANQKQRQRDILFTPLSLVGGIAPSDDPMLISRTRAYRVSHRRRSGDQAAHLASQ
ncbi:catalase family peroxidase [Jiella mangrovi]|uniref:Catalase-related peroxidase n=1 Tax=Jiella mangrovi TaxID=2821407 RepID=A0ABS4BLI4_9HYPH|nr:catalase family peroxidase [Jiella mangrovi]MBP0617579.1 catalase family peroxidase [Jiella mangrovi]